MAFRRLRCISCNNKLVLWGKTSSGKKRWYCKKCKSSRTYHKRKKVDVFALFKQYVLWGDTYEQLSSQSGHSKRFLIEKFHAYLKLDPPYLPKFNQARFEEAYLLIDGLWFSRWYVLMVYRQSKSLRILHISVAGKEASGSIIKDLKKLIFLGYRFTGVVSDGGTGIVKAILEVFGHIPHQICLAHMYRRVIAAIGRYPKDIRVRQLRSLADHIWLIESKEALSWWKGKLQLWINNNHEFIWEYKRDNQGHWWYIHKGLRKAVRILVSLLDFSFTFLNHPLMPKTTNELEAQFGHLGKRWLVHRGLKRQRWENFMKWFTYFYNKEKISRNITEED